MNKMLSAIAGAALLTAAVTSLAAGQREPTVTQSNGRTFLDSQITLGTDYPPITNKVFVNMPVLQLKKGAVLPSRGMIGKLGMDRMLSLRQFDFAIGPRTVQYPVIGLMRCSNFSDTGSFVKVIASKTALRAEARAGEAVRSGGFLIEAKREIKARETIPTVRVSFGDQYFIFSIEEAPQTKADSMKPMPLLSIAQEQASARDREIALEAWRLSNQSVREGILRPSTPTAGAPGTP